MIAVIIFGDAGVDIMRGIDINFTIKHMCRWIGRVNGTDQRLRKGILLFCLYLFLLLSARRCFFS
jgi:hypothetical protein